MDSSGSTQKIRKKKKKKNFVNDKKRMAKKESFKAKSVESGGRNINDCDYRKDKMGKMVGGFSGARGEK